MLWLWVSGCVSGTKKNGLQDVFVATASTGGAISGIGKRLKENNPNVKVVLADPEGSVYKPYFEGKEDKGPRREIMYFAASGMLNAIRVDDWKVAFAIERGAINDAARETPAWPVITNLRADPFESASRESGMYIRWYADNMWLMVPAQTFVQSFFETIDDYPFQAGGSLSAANIGYGTIERQKAMGSLQKLMDISIQN